LNPPPYCTHGNAPLAGRREPPDSQAPLRPLHFCLSQCSIFGTPSRRTPAPQDSPQQTSLVRRYPAAPLYTTRLPASQREGKALHPPGDGPSPVTQRRTMPGFMFQAKGELAFREGRPPAAGWVSPTGFPRDPPSISMSVWKHHGLEASREVPSCSSQQPLRSRIEICQQMHHRRR